MMAKWKAWIAQSAQQAQDTVRQEINTIEDTAGSVGDVVRSMHDLYGKIRVTIAIEPIS